MTTPAAILGAYFFLFLGLTVGAQEIPNEVTDVPMILNVTNSDQVGQDASTLNTTTETRPKCKQILKDFFDESVNNTRPLIEESIINATKSLLTDEIFPNVNDAIQTEASKLTGLINEKDAKVETLEKRMAHEKEEFKGLIKGLVQKVTGLERSISSKDTEIAQLNGLVNGLVQKVSGLEESIASKDTENAQLKEQLNALDKTVNTRVIFGAVKKSGGRNINGVLTFDEEILNVGNGMDIRSGKFEAPVEGYYIFSFTGTAYDPDDELVASVDVYKNGEFVFDFDDWNSKGTDQQRRVMSGTWMAHLNRGDTIHLSVDYGYLTTDNEQKIHFSGQMVLKSD